MADCFCRKTERWDGEVHLTARLSKLSAIFKKANSEQSRNIAQHPLSLGRGGVPIAVTRNTSPAASIRRLRTIFLVTPPPLLAVMRRGEFAFSK